MTWFDAEVPRLVHRLARQRRSAPICGSLRGERVVRFEELMLPHTDSVYRTAYHLSRNATEAEDLTQEAFLRAFRAFDDYRGGNARAWLLTILRNLFLDECRRRGHVITVELDTADTTSRIGNVPGPSWSPSAENEALRRLPSEALDRAFAALPPDWRLMILLADVEEFSYREIAEVMGVPLGTVMSRLHRARKRLQERLKSTARPRVNRHEKSA